MNSHALIVRSVMLVVAGWGLLTATSQAQQVLVSASLEASEEKGESTLVVQVRLPRGLHTYGRADEPAPVKLNIIPSKEFETTSEPEIPDGDAKTSDSGTRYQLGGEFQIRQKIRLLAEGSSRLTGSVTMVICEKELCRPPKEFEFEVSLPTSEAAKIKAASSEPSGAAEPATSTADPEFDSNQPFDWQSLQDTLINSAKRAREATVAIDFEGMGSATAVIVSPDGLILTAGHCVNEPGTEFTIRLNDKRSFPAVGLGMEPTYDCGLVQIDKESLEGVELPWAEIGNAVDLKRNMPVFSLGHGGGYDPGRGSFLRLGRVLEPCSTNSGFVKNTCLMEPGDSGGPLFNIHGQVVGIHSMIHKSLDANFDVPVELFRHYCNNLEEQKKFRWHSAGTNPDFGLNLLRGRNRMTGSIADGEQRGIRISKISSDGWAESQGLKRSDRVLKWQGAKVTDPQQLNLLMIRSYLMKESSVKLTVKRRSEVKEIELDFTNLETDTQPASSLNQPNIEPAKLEIIPGLAHVSRHLSPLENRLDDYSVVLVSNKKKINGTLAFWLEDDATQFVVTKSSLLKSDEVDVQLEPHILVSTQPDEKLNEMKGKVVARNNDNDLALIELSQPVPLEHSSPPTSTLNTKTLPLGTFLVSPSLADEGEFSVLSSGEFNSLGGGYLGIEPKRFRSACVIGRVMEGTPADKTGMKAGDRIIEMNEKEITEPQTLFQSLDKTKPNEKATFVVVRGGKELKLEVVLSRRPADMNPPMQGGHIADEFEGGKSKSTEFDKVLTHDSRVKADECGGPVFDLTGAFVGINAARKSRTQTYILPAAVVADFVTEHRKQEQD